MPSRKSASSQTQTVYQVKISLKGIRPPIWRRVQVLSTTTLQQLHPTFRTPNCHRGKLRREKSE